MGETTMRGRARVAVIGAGFGGLGAAIKLRQAGHDVVIFERAGDVGGVWRDNTYPGAACDVQSHLYSFSFDPNPNWSRQYSPQAEILEYLRGVVRRFALRPLLRLNTDVARAEWDAEAAQWRVTSAASGSQPTSPTTENFDHVVLATGALAEPVTPKLPGLDTFVGPVFHTSRWDHSFDYAGKRVAVVGTGASAIQVVPAIQPDVAHLTLFQRTPAWVMPRHDEPIARPLREIYRRVPLVQKAMRGFIWAEREYKVLGFRHPTLIKRIGEKEALNHLKTQIPDPELRAKVTPAYRLGCKRVLLSNTYYLALTQPNVSVTTNGIERVTPTGIVDDAGQEHDVDAIIFATGFDTSVLPLSERVIGPSGATLKEEFGSSPKAYLGTSVAGFPNLYLMHGPNIGLGHTSVIMMFESQFNYITAAVNYCATHRVVATPTAEAQDAFVRLVAKLDRGTVWTDGGCSSWYLDATGRNANIWPGSTIGYQRRARRFVPGDHVLTSVSASGAVA